MKKKYSSIEIKDAVSIPTNDLSDLESSNSISNPSRIDIFPNIHKFMKQQLIKYEKINEATLSNSSEKLYEDRYNNNNKIFMYC